MKKVTTIRLVLILVVLLIIYTGIEFFSSTGRSKSLRKELISIDTARVTQLLITKENITTSLSKKGNNWEVSTVDGSFAAETSKVVGVLMSLQTIQPSRIATRNPDKWKDFQVDSTGTRVQIFEGDRKSLDIILGRFGMQGQQQFFTYVRLFEDNDVYAANNFMTFSIPTDVAGFRNQTLTSLAPDSISAIQFHYPADSSFILEKSLNDKWVMGNLISDSTTTSSFLQSISHLSSAKFYNEITTGFFNNSEYEVTIILKNYDPVTIKALKVDDTYLLQSDHNPQVIVSDPELFNKVFRGSRYFHSLEE